MNFLALFVGLAGAIDPLAFNMGGDCSRDLNQPMYFNMNNDCRNAGSCVAHFPGHNPPDGLGKCECCDPYTIDNVCEGSGWLWGKFTGTQCSDYVHYLHSIISYVFHIDTWDATDPYVGKEGEFKCHKGGDGLGADWDSAEAASVPDMLPLARAIINDAGYWQDLVDVGYNGYGGIVVRYHSMDSGDQHCRICMDSSMCVVYTNGVAEFFGEEDAGGHLMVSFATDFNTYYSETKGGPSCAKPNNIMPDTEGESLTNPGCAKNTEKGLEGYNSWVEGTQGGDVAEKHGSHYIELAEEPTATPVGTPDYPVNGFGFGGDIAMEKVHISVKQASGVLTGGLPLPTLSPTKKPTDFPTPTPVEDDSCFSYGYTHQIEDLKFKGIAQAGGRGCRHGLETSWPGGLSADMCKSPYVICLPEANTPNVGFPIPDGSGGIMPAPGDAYLSNTAPYSIEQCKKECAYDQRCTGFEFWGEPDSQFGYCSLIDDIPIEMGTSANAGIATEADLMGQSNWHPAALGGRICYEKEAPCNPYFAEDQIDDVMLKCYCPNNRKGFYTKKVHRTVAASVFCGADEDGMITKRIREAQANRMFHLCENWCLFNTQTPRTESWYHDPWKVCWREQYAGVGTHRSYCYRVIRDPMTIEQYFIDTRAANMCPDNLAGNRNTGVPTQSPVDPSDVGFTLAGETESCDDACGGGSSRCDENITNSANGGNLASFRAEITSAFSMAGIDCEDTFEVGKAGWALPGVDSDMKCILRNDATQDTPCNLAIGVGYRRLCACTSAST